MFSILKKKLGHELMLVDYSFFHLILAVSRLWYDAAVVDYLCSKAFTRCTAIYAFAQFLNDLRMIVLFEENAIILHNTIIFPT